MFIFLKVFKNIAIWFLVPMLLIALWMLASLFHYSAYGFSAIVDSYDSQNIVDYNDKEIHRGRIVSGFFRAKENNLGLVAVRFFNFNRDNTDIVEFRIKKKEDAGWYYINTYKTNQFLPNELFTFGFPIIADSINHEYKFQIESLRGRSGNAIALSTYKPTFVAVYKHDTSLLIENKFIFIRFLVNKFLISFNDLGFFFSSLVYLSPLVLYLSWLLFLRKYIKLLQSVIIFFILQIVLLVIFSNNINIILQLIIITIWLILIKLNRYDNTVTFLLALLTYVMCPVLIIFGQMLAVENAARLTYFFILIGTLQSLYELWKKPRKMVSYNVIFRKSK